jgi:hypothetical protein
LRPPENSYNIEEGGILRLRMAQLSVLQHQPGPCSSLLQPGNSEIQNWFYLPDSLKQNESFRAWTVSDNGLLTTCFWGAIIFPSLTKILKRSTAAVIFHLISWRVRRVLF